MSMPTFLTFVQFDAEAKVWVTDSSDIPGLVAEAPDLSGLYSSVQDAAPVLLRENLYKDQPPVGGVQLEFVVIEQNTVTHRDVAHIDLGAVPG